MTGTRAALLAGCTSVVDVGGGPDPTPAVVEGERTSVESPASPEPVAPTDGDPRSQAQGEIASVVGALRDTRGGAAPVR
ncbi:hypothetical protein ITJ44_10140 [Clavibacter sp. VKM Ac-2873]|uniref:hypothetical protein n=1 Tax=Clavibacter sp. VKM Ac-2873 TaxID=2783813 RepID=UPI00188D8762|nr:hypothetical protein [Clavibacter sp. VKM Ac-2873]MBF4618430.1 hypothetical protein [Clavibacter sp. VKM Ac-2873]